MLRMARVLAVALGVAAGACASSRGAGWVASRTDNVTVYTESLLEHRFPQEWLEQSFAAYRAFFPDLPAKPVDVVYLKKEPGALLRFYSPLATGRDAWSVETLPSQGRIGRDGLLVLEDRRNHHEAALLLAHQFVSRALPSAPLWLQVGMARYLAGYRMHYEGKLWLVCFGSMGFPSPPDARFGNVLMPLQDLFSWDWYRYASWRGRNWYGYTAHVLVHFLVHGGEGGFHRERFNVFLRAIRDGKGTDDALATAYPHILPHEWEDLVAEHARPVGKRRLMGGIRTIPQGLCLRIPPADRAARRPDRSPVAREEIVRVLDDLRWIDVFRKNVPWMPADVVTAEAARRRSPHRGPAPPAPAPAPAPGTRPAPPTAPDDTDKAGRGQAPSDADIPVLRGTP